MQFQVKSSPQQIPLGVLGYKLLCSVVPLEVRDLLSHICLSHHWLQPALGRLLDFSASGQSSFCSSRCLLKKVVGASHAEAMEMGT